MDEFQMLKVTLMDGSVYTGRNISEVIEQLKLEDYTDYDSHEEYKSNISRRVKNFNGEILIYTSSEEFMQELIRVKFIKEIKWL